MVPPTPAAISPSLTLTLLYLACLTSHSLFFEKAPAVLLDALAPASLNEFLALLNLYWRFCFLASLGSPRIIAVPPRHPGLSANPKSPPLSARFLLRCFWRSSLARWPAEVRWPLPAS